MPKRSALGSARLRYTNFAQRLWLVESHALESVGRLGQRQFCINERAVRFMLARTLPVLAPSQCQSSSRAPLQYPQATLQKAAHSFSCSECWF